MRKIISQMKRRFKNFKLYQKMLSVYILIFGAFSAISIGAMQLTLTIYDGKLYEKSLQELNYFANNIDNELSSLENLSFSVAVDYDIQKQLSGMMELEDRQEYAFHMSGFRSRLLVEALTTDMLSSIIYTDRGTALIDVGKSQIDIPKEYYLRILQESDAAKGGYVYIEPTVDFPYLISGRDIRKHIDYSLKYLGTMIFLCDISDIIDRNYAALANPVTELCIFSEDSVIYVNSEEHFKEIPDLEGNQGYKIVNLNHDKYFMCYLKSEKTGWTYVNMFPYSSIYNLNSLVRTMMLCGFTLLFLMSILIMRKISRVITRPLEQLIGSVQIVKTGEFEKAKEHLGEADTFDEVGILKNDFQIMLDKIMVLIHENYEKQIILKDTQYKALQAQINPHFLYNTLNSINWMIKADRNQEASRMIMSLGNLLHAAFKKETMSTLAEEVDLLRSYIAIQQIRYDQRASFLVKFEDSLGVYEVPRMILQPLVENSIYHGVENQLKPCKIEVDINQQEGYLFIEVKDDGPGMEEEHLEKVRSHTMKPKGNGIGLKNIQERLELVFEEHYVFEIESRLGEGTKVRIAVPLYRGNKIV